MKQKLLVIIILLCLINPLVLGSSLLELGHKLFLQKRYPEAMKVYNRLVSESSIPEIKPEAIYMSALCYLKMGNATMAERAFWELLNDYSDSVWCESAYMIMADTRRRMDRSKLSDALLFYEMVPSRFPDSHHLPDAWLGAALIKQRLGYYKEAAKAYRRAVQAADNQINTDEQLMHMAEYFADPENPERDIEKSIRYLDALVTRYVHSRYLAEAYFALGKLHWETGHRETAIQYFQELVNRNIAPFMTDQAQINLAELYLEIRDTDNAVSTYKKIISKQSMSPETRKRFLETIENLQAKHSSKPTISAWTSEKDEKKRIVQYSGDVHVSIGMFSFLADTAEVDYSENSITAQGGVRVGWSDSHVIHARKIVCHIKSQTAIVTGNVSYLERTESGFRERHLEKVEMSMSNGEILAVKQMEGKSDE